MNEKLSDSWRGWVRTHADGADREYGYVLCTITASLELELAQAQADVEALRRYYIATEKYIPVAEYGGGVCQDMGADVVQAIMDEYYAAEAALPERLRGAS